MMVAPLACMADVVRWGRVALSKLKCERVFVWRVWEAWWGVRVEVPWYGTWVGEAGEGEADQVGRRGRALMGAAALLIRIVGVPS